VIPDRPSADEARIDLFMLTLSGGRQRTLDEFRRLADSADLMLHSVGGSLDQNSLVELSHRPEN
jgi:hypothetical protein